jgi:hypothetical protein
MLKRPTGKRACFFAYYWMAGMDAKKEAKATPSNTHQKTSPEAMAAREIIINQEGGEETHLKEGKCAGESDKSNGDGKNA